MNNRHTLIAIVLSLGLSACGGPSSDSSSRADTSTTGSEVASVRGVERQSNPMPVAELVRGSEYVDGHPSMDAPKLTVRVLGPTPMDTLATAPAARFETRVRVQNDGDEVAVVEQARVEFDVWSDAGVQSRCIADEASDMDETIAPGEFAEMTAVAQCALPSPGEYEVRTYVAFEADARDGSTDIERYYAGRRDIVVR